MSIKIIWSQWGHTPNRCPHEQIVFLGGTSERLEETVLEQGESGQSYTQTIRSGSQVQCCFCSAYGEIVSCEDTNGGKLNNDV